MSSVIDIIKPKLITEKFDEPVLYEPARPEYGCNSLKIITAFTDCERISSHMINLSDGMKENKYVNDLSVDIILGMTKSSLSQKKHNDICRLMRYLKGMRGMPKVNCYYINKGPEVHSKVYIWGSDHGEELPIYQVAYCGSLNYTMNAFYRRRESVCTVDALKAYWYYKELLKDSINCLDPLAIERVKNVENDGVTAEENDAEDADYSVYIKMTPVDTITVSLLRADGSDTGYGSGINWGIRPNGTRRNKNQAYIPYNHNDKKPGFFPDRIKPDDINCPIFRVITSDFGVFHMRMAQQGNKGLHSAESNALLGEWIRKRLGVPSGGYITKQMLELYGKTYVTFRKYSDGTYLLDF